MTPSLSDADLVRMVTEHRDHSAFEILFTAYYPRVKKHLHKVYKCTDQDAEDAAQYAFACLWSGMTIKQDSAMPLLCRYASNFHISEWRKTRRLVSLTPVDDKKPVDVPEVKEIAEPDFPADMLTAIPRGIARLDERYRTAIELRFQRDLSLAEIGAVIGKDISTASRRLAAGINSIRKFLRVPKPKEAHYHTRPKLKDKAYAACVSVDKAMDDAGRVIDGIKKPVASVGVSGKQRQGL